MQLHQCFVCLRGVCSLWRQPYLYSAHRGLIICHHLHSFTACDQYVTTTACQQALQCRYSATVPHQAALSHHKWHLFTTHSSFLPLPSSPVSKSTSSHPLTPTISALCRSEWGGFEQFCPLSEQPQAKIWPQLCSTPRNQQWHKVKVSLSCAFNKPNVAL